MMLSEPVLIAVDPGIHHLGVAVFVEGKLAHATLVLGQGGASNPLLEVCRPLRKLLTDMGLISTLGVTSVLEVPQIYQTAQQKGRQSDIAKLLFTAGAVGMILGELGSLLCTEPHPWKGNLPKEVTASRAKAKLSAEELATIEWPEDHNVWDGIALGMWRLSRLEFGF